MINSNLIQLDFKPARLVIPKSSDKWYIIFYIYDVRRGQMVRKRVYDLPKGRTKEERYFLANALCHELNLKFKEGIISDKAQFNKTQIIRNNISNPHTPQISIIICIYRILNQKLFREERTRSTYQSIIESFCKFIESEYKKDIPDIKTFNISHAKNYMNNLLKSGLSPRTHNNHLLTLRTIWAQGIELKFLENNPFKEIPRLKCPIGKNIAYLPNQQIEVLKFAEKYPEMLFLIKFMYYTLARTNEISQLKIKHIGMFTPDKIYIPAGISKNDHERHVIIPPGLEKEFCKFSIRNLNPEWYIFSKDKFKPGPLRMHTKRIGQKYREWILSKLNYPIEYTLYSWKHTGVIAAHKAGVSDDDIMLQTGHLDYGSFQKYLKSLSLYDNKNFALKIPEI